MLQAPPLRCAGWCGTPAGVRAEVVAVQVPTCVLPLSNSVGKSREQSIPWSLFSTPPAGSHGQLQEHAGSADQQHWQPRHRILGRQVWRLRRRPPGGGRSGHGGRDGSCHRFPLPGAFGPGCHARARARSSSFARLPATRCAPFLDWSRDEVTTQRPLRAMRHLAGKAGAHGHGGGQGPLPARVPQPPG